MELQNDSKKFYIWELYVRFPCGNNYSNYHEHFSSVKKAWDFVKEQRAKNYEDDMQPYSEYMEKSFKKWVLFMRPNFEIYFIQPVLVN